MITLRRAAAIMVTVVVTLLASTGLALAQTNNSAVTIADFQFTPATMQVAQGTTVTWTNNGPSNHTATSDTGAWDSGVLAPGKSFSFKFNTPGTFAFHCSIHPNMKGTITVMAAGASASPAASTSASQAAAPTQLPRTGGGGGTPITPLWLLTLVPLAGFGAWRFRRSASPDRD
ncbi:MAG TPA: cupredoxin family copper-binding protein [Chloroflexota bacterium]|nr:cupredoxin family copper-binding protein [Chloroflexota bacterium]